MNNITSVLEKLSFDTEISPAERVGYSADLSISSLSEEAQTILNQCVILHWFDQEIIGRLLPSLSENKVNNVINEVSSLTFISKLPYGLAFHGLAREGLLSLYKEQRKDLYVNCAQETALILSKRKDDASLLEAFYCFIVAGAHDEARKIKNQITNDVSQIRGTSLDSRVLNLQNEAEMFPFVKPEKIYDVFVSSHPGSREWVNGDLLPRLSRAGKKVAVEYIDANSDELTLLNVQLLARHSKTILTVVTKDWEELSGLENKVIQDSLTYQPSSKIIPLIIDARNIPKQLENFSSIDFTHKDQKIKSWNRLLEVLGREPQTLVASNNVSDNWYLVHPYPMPPHFTGRAVEFEMLDNWLANSNDRLFILRALGGFGKSALAWQWINTHVNPSEWPKLIWWSFYEGDASFENFIRETLQYLKLDIPQGQRPQVDELLKAMQAQKILFVMDGFERALRAYSSMNAAYQGDEENRKEDNGRDCVNINAEIFLKNVCVLPNIKSKVLMTTRLTPRAVYVGASDDLPLQGFREVELTSMQPTDAVKFFQKQNIKGTRAEIEAACSTYGYHPLSLRLLAGRILKDFENPADIVVAQKLKIDGDVIQQKHHVLEVSYNSLPSREQKLLSTIACFRSPVALKTIQSIADNKETIDDDLHDLLERGSLHFDNKNKKFDLHPIVRRYSYNRLTVHDRISTHTRLREYFAAVDVPAKPKNIDDLAPIIELYHHSVRAGHLDDARELYRDRLRDVLYYQFGAFEVIGELMRGLFIDGEDNPPRLKDAMAQALTINYLANAYSLSGQPRRAALLFESLNEMLEKNNDKKNLAIGLGNAAQQQLVIGALRAAERNNRRNIELCDEIEDEFWDAVGRQFLGNILSYRGAWQDAKQEFDTSLNLFRKLNSVQSESVIWSYLALRFLLMAREQVNNGQLAMESVRSAIESARQALELADETAKTQYPFPRDYIRGYWLHGTAYRFISDLDKAEENLSKAISICRQINMVDYEANILIDFARLRYDQKNYEEAKNLADEALIITERCGYVLQGADVNLFLAQYALEQENDKAKAKEHAETALKLAYCDGPPYYYKVAYHEAERFLENLK